MQNLVKIRKKIYISIDSMGYSESDISLDPPTPKLTSPRKDIME